MKIPLYWRAILYLLLYSLNLNEFTAQYSAQLVLYIIEENWGGEWMKKRTKFYSLIKVWFVLKSECYLLLIFKRSVGFLYSILTACHRRASKNRFLFFIYIKVNIFHITIALMPD